jgi:hypothetical protein
MPLGAIYIDAFKHSARSHNDRGVTFQQIGCLGTLGKFYLNEDDFLSMTNPRERPGQNYKGVFSPHSHNTPSCKSRPDFPKSDN